MNFLLVVSIVWVISETAISVLLRKPGADTEYDKSSLRILWITITISVFAGIIFRKTSYSIHDDLGILFYHIGIFFMLAGLLVRWIAILKLKDSFTAKVFIAEHQKIIQSGIYRYIRHPSYSGSLISFFGLGLAFNNWITLIIIFIPVTGAFIHRIRIEEKVLVRAFGSEYTDYMKRSWRLFPLVY